MLVSARHAYSMFTLIFNKDDLFFYEEKKLGHLREHLKKMTPNSDLQFSHKESAGMGFFRFLTEIRFFWAIWVILEIDADPV